MTPLRWPSQIAAALGFLAVALGAFGAHGLKVTLVARDTAALWEKAVFFHLVHAVVLWTLRPRNGRPSLPWWFFLAGILLFSGSLYGLALVRIAWFGPITPLGGLALLIGWMLLVVNPNHSSYRKR
ncbi:MAG: DUF423 domain-containing protein [Verrucomicrobiales bacterium]